MTRLLYYALGGGYGHLTRTRHIITELQSRQSVETLVLVPERGVDVLSEVTPCRATPPVSRGQLGRWVRESVETFDPDLVMVDTFPRGVLGELSLDSSKPHLLVTRYVDPDFYDDPGVREALAAYKEVYQTESVERDLEPVTSGETPLPRTLARQELQVEGDHPLILALGSGPVRVQVKQARDLQKVAQANAWQVRFFSRELGTAIDGLGRLLRAADVVVSASGYNSYYEIAEAGVPALLCPQRRRVDNQRLRAMGRLGWPLESPFRVLTSPHPKALEAELTFLLSQEPAPPVTYRGRHQIAQRILNHLNPTPALETCP